MDITEIHVLVHESHLGLQFHVGQKLKAMLMVDADLEEQIEYQPIDVLPFPQVHQFVKGE